MNDDEAESALWVLSDPIAWEHDERYANQTHWLGWYGSMETRYFAFLIVSDAHEDLGSDEEGIRFAWKVNASLWGGVHVRNNSCLWLNFPARTLWEAQAICERAAIAGDFAGLDARDAQRHPLVWSFWCFHFESAAVPGEDSASIYRRDRSVGYFRVSRCDTDLSIAPTCRRHFNDPDGNPLRFLALYEANMENVNLLEQERECLREHHCRASGVSPFRYETEAEAKAACERYYATGRWE